MNKALVIVATALLLQGASGTFAQEASSRSILGNLIRGDFSGRGESEASGRDGTNYESHAASSDQRENHQESRRPGSDENRSDDRSGSDDGGHESSFGNDSGSHDRATPGNGREGDDNGRDSGSNDHESNED